MRSGEIGTVAQPPTRKISGNRALAGHRENVGVSRRHDLEEVLVDVRVIPRAVGLSLTRDVPVLAQVDADEINLARAKVDRIIEEAHAGRDLQAERAAANVGNRKW